MENTTPADTQCRSAHIIEDIPKTKFDNLEQDIITAKYQSLVGSLLWLSYAIHPNICVATSLIAQYNKQPSSGHYDAARYVLKYLIGTSDHGLRFAHKTNKTLVNFIGFVVPAPDTTFSYANWGPQTAPVPSPSQPPKITDTSYTISLYGGHVTHRSGGPISWSVFREAQTSHSSCESEIKSADEATILTQHPRHVLSDLNMHNATKPTPAYNDNQGCVDWSKSTYIKNLRHFNIR
jgi:hypothetical protein